MAKTIQEYLSLPYTIILRRDDRDRIFVARVEELQGCSAHGENEQEALSNLRDNMAVWIEDCIEAGDPVPEPAKEIELPSGKWLQRVPRSLHLRLVRLAKEEGVSLNQLVTSALAETVGRRPIQTPTFAMVSASAVGIVGASQHSNFPYLLGTTPCSVMVAHYDLKNEVGLVGAISAESEAYMEQLLSSANKPSWELRSERETYAEHQKALYAFQS